LSAAPRSSIAAASARPAADHQCRRDHQKCDHRQPGRDPVEQAEHSLGVGQVLRLDDGEGRVDLRNARSDGEALVDQLVLDRADERCDVDRDGALGDVNCLGPFAGQDGHHLGVGLAVGLDPGLLEDVGSHQSVDPVGDEAGDRAGERPADRFERGHGAWGQPLRVEGVHDVPGHGLQVQVAEDDLLDLGRDGVLYGRIGGQGGDGLDIPVGVLYLVAGPGRQYGDRCEQSGDADQDAGDQRTPPPPSVRGIPVRLVQLTAELLHLVA
jgi:hypothetical protein